MTLGLAHVPRLGRAGCGGTINISMTYAVRKAMQRRRDRRRKIERGIEVLISAGNLGKADTLIRRLDAQDAPHEDLEPSLGYLPYGGRLYPNINRGRAPYPVDAEADPAEHQL